MFSRKKQAKPLKAVPLKFVSQGENLDVANSIMSVEMATKSKPKTPRVSRRKASTMSSQRRSASIERIFEKQKSSEEKKKQELQKHLKELRLKEQELKKPAPAKVALNLPPPPPPPPPMSNKPRVIAPGKVSKPGSVVAAMGPTQFAIEKSDILNIRSKLRKVTSTPVKEQPKEEDEFLGILKSRISQMRSYINEPSSDDEDSESSSTEEF